MKITVVTPLYNAAPYIAQTVESVLAQTHPEVEHIVVDDGSTDRSADIVERTFTRASDEKNVQTYLLRQQNRGVAAARNRGAAEAGPDSQYVLFLDADDVLLPDALGRLAGYLEAHPEAGVVACASVKIDAGGHPLGRTTRTMESGHSSMRMVPSRFGVQFLPDTDPRTPLTAILSGYHGFIPSCALIRRSVLDDTPGFDEDFGQPWEDNDLFVHLALRSEVHYLPERLVHYRQHDQQSTRDREKNQRQEHKFRRKWASPGTLNLAPAQHQALTEALHFWEYRAKSVGGLQTAVRLFREGDLRRALLFLGGALRRYPRSLHRRYGSFRTK